MPDVSDLWLYRQQLQDARFSGVRSFTDQNGETVEYRSQREIELAIVAIDNEIRNLQGGRNGLIRMQTSKGL